NGDGKATTWYHARIAVVVPHRLRRGLVSFLSSAGRRGVSTANPRVICNRQLHSSYSCRCGSLANAPMVVPYFYPMGSRVRFNFYICCSRTVAFDVGGVPFDYYPYWFMVNGHWNIYQENNTRALTRGLGRRED